MDTSERSVLPEDLGAATLDVQASSGRRLLVPGRTCWRLEKAERVAWIVDGAEYFAVTKAAMRRARHSILLLAWDFDPRIRLEPEKGEPPRPDRLDPLLRQVMELRPDLRIHVLQWRMAKLFAVTRRTLPLSLGDHYVRGRMALHFDDEHPAGACQHQKVLVIDDAIAFCGGIDFAGNRWDTRAHHDREPARRDPDGEPFEPRHDIMLAVDGAAAAALGDLARERWRLATGERLDPPPPRDPGDEVWPDRLRPRLRRVAVGIARTLPAWRGRPEIREVEALYRDSIAAARRSIFLESQYFTSDGIGEALAARLAEPDGPEIVVLSPEHGPSWLERHTMDRARDRLIARLRAADRSGRFRVYAPMTAGGSGIIVHSKVAVIDDRLLRIGSANLADRSLGLDSECDLAVEAVPGAANEDAVRRAVRAFRNSLLAEHLGVPAERVAAEIARTGSLILAIERLNDGAGRHLKSLQGGTNTGSLAASRIFDPDRPLRARDLLRGLWSR